MAKLVGAVIVGALAALGGVLIAIHNPSPSHPRIKRAAAISHPVATGPSGVQVAALFGGTVTRLPVALRHHTPRRHHAARRAHTTPAPPPSTSSSPAPSAPSQPAPTSTYTPPTYSYTAPTYTPTHYTAPTTVQPATTSHTTAPHRSKPQSGTTTIG
jgi:hypothetical protein